MCRSSDSKLTRLVSEKALVFTDVFMDIMAKRISNKIITCNDKDARWITPRAPLAKKYLSFLR